MTTTTTTTVLLTMFKLTEIVEEEGYMQGCIYHIWS